jgi:dihydrofolate reductase
MKISLVVAMAENGVIGRGGNPPFDLPWHLPADLQRFKRLTTGHVIVMGRKTFESIGRPLPRRRSVVITRDPGYRYGGPFPRGSSVTVVHGFDEALAAAADEDEVFVVGGAEVFARALPRAERLYLTRVHAEVEGDVRFPRLDRGAFQLAESERHEADERHAHPFSFELWERS